jgi:hypothetical protein
MPTTPFRIVDVCQLVNRYHPESLKKCGVNKSHDQGTNGDKPLATAFK